MKLRYEIDPIHTKLVLNTVERVCANSKLDELGLVGIIGSGTDNKIKPIHDLDVIFTPHENSNLGACLNDVNRIICDIGASLKENGLIISATPRKVDQAPHRYITRLNNPDISISIIPLHTLFYTDKERYTEINPVGFSESVEKTLITIHGSLDNMPDKPIDKKVIESLMLVSDYNISQSLQAHPHELTMVKLQELSDYVTKYYGVDLGKTLPSNDADIQKHLEEINLELYGQYAA
ncbi:MAG: hypothetical protein HRU03_04145 [Nanoarchaeales archaeon]|nr:hypothetical protein [Nanoarchaeales archaeon]